MIKVSKYSEARNAKPVLDIRVLMAPHLWALSAVLPEWLASTVSKVLMSPCSCGYGNNIRSAPWEKATQSPKLCGQFSCHSLQSSDLILAVSKFSISSVGEGGSKGQGEREREATKRKIPLLECSYLCECLPRQQDWVWWHELEGQWGAVQKCLNSLCSWSLGKKSNFQMWASLFSAI